MKLEYNGYKVSLKTDTYKESGDRIISLVDAQGLPLLTATVNIPNKNLKNDEVFIKNWSENRGILTWLQDKGIVTEVIETYPIGMAFAQKCKIDIDRLEELEEQQSIIKQ